MPHPILILQPRRLGDLILTFPLILDAHMRFPESPIWLVARREFFEPLMPFAPGAVCFQLDHLPALANHAYEVIINLGGTVEATAICAGKAKAELKLGPLRLQSGELHVEGYWQLYRQSLIVNNRHNAFHWADLFRMDFTPFPLPAMVRERPRPQGTRRIGLFVGASEMAKRPEPHFWASLARRLTERGFKPVLLGGTAEISMGAAVLAKGTTAANFCGKTSLAQLAAILRTLDLLITPDTGPMHLADWLGAPVLNLSMGPVQALETGPCSPGQHVLRPVMSCIGCWQCQRGKLHCRQKFLAQAVAGIAANIAAGNTELAAPPGFELLTTARNDLRLHRLHGRRQTAATALDAFWQAAFLFFNDAAQHGRLQQAAAKLATDWPRLAEAMRKVFGKLIATVAVSGRKGEPLPQSFWRDQPWHCRLFAGHLQMTLQNSNYAMLAQVLGRIEAVQAVLAGQ